MAVTNTAVDEPNAAAGRKKAQSNQAREPFLGIALAAAVLLPRLFVLDMPSMMLALRLRYPWWVFATHVLRAASALSRG